MKAKTFLQYLTESKNQEVELTVSEYAVAINGKVYWGDFKVSATAEYELADPEVGIMFDGWTISYWDVIGSGDDNRISEIIDPTLFEKLQRITFNKYSAEEIEGEDWMSSAGLADKSKPEDLCCDLIESAVYDNPETELRELSDDEVAALLPSIDKITSDPDRNNTESVFDPIKKFNIKVESEFEDSNLYDSDDRDYYEGDYDSSID